MKYIIATGLILDLIILIIFILKNSREKFKKYIIIFNCIGVVIIIAMIVVNYVDAKMLDRDRAKYEIIGRTGLHGVSYEGEKEGYYVVCETGLFYVDYLLLSADKVKLSSMCYPGGSVLLYCEQDGKIVYDEENVIKLRDGTSGYYTDAVIMIKPDFIELSFWVIFIDTILLILNNMVCFVVVVLKRRGKVKNWNLAG